jgi:hypothetical protein
MSRFQIYISRLDTSAKSEHHPECDEESCSDKEKCLRTSLSLSDWRFWFWSLGSTSCSRCYWSWNIELVGDTLVVSRGCTLSRCREIECMVYRRESEESDHFTCFLICTLECVSCTELCFEEFYFLSRSEEELIFCLSRRDYPYDITRVLPDSGLTRWSCCPCTCTESYHIWSFLLFFVCRECRCWAIRPVVEESCESLPYLHCTSIETLITAIDGKCWVRTTAYSLVFTERWSCNWSDRSSWGSCECILGLCYWSSYRSSIFIARSSECERYSCDKESSEYNCEWISHIERKY